MSLTPEAIWRLLADVPDPELPAVSVVDLGIVQAVEVESSRVRVAITPTFAGCPALHTIRETIRERLLEAGAEAAEVIDRLSPPWSSDWITPTGREKLKAFGIAPPPSLSAELPLLSLEVAACPYCGSHDTTLQNSFGPTLCRAIFTCNACRQPFEQFKPL